MSRTLLLAGSVLAGEPPTRGADALLLRADRVEWAGPRAESPSGPDVEVIDLGDAVVVPGFVDAHVHLCHYVHALGWLDLSAARSPAEVVSRLRRAATSAPEGQWIGGWGYRESIVASGGRLVRSHLDRVSRDRPVLVAHASFHSGVANSAALAAVGFGRATPRWPGGELERDLRGEPNGRAWERAYSVLETAAKRDELDALGASWGERARSVARHFLAEGVTSICEAGVRPAEMTELVKADLPIDVVAMPVGARGLFATPRDALEGPRTGEWMGNVRVGPLKLFADGAERGCFRIPLPAFGRAARGLAGRDRPSALDALRLLRPRPAPGAVRTGIAHYEPERLRALVVEATERGFAVAIHALGNEGIRYALDALEAVGGAGNRIEHAMFAEERDAERMARLGITAVTQPGHLMSYGELVRTAGIEEKLPPVPLRRLIDAGVHVALSSDGPTALWEPLRTMPVAVTRRAETGQTLAPGEAIDPDEALAAATLGAARAAGLDDRGALVPAARADLAVLSGDPFSPATKVRETWVAGRRVHPGAP